MLHWLQTNWYSVTLTTWTVVNFVLNGVSSSLSAPTATSSESYTFWFKFVNYCALNISRAKNNARIEDSPNFQAAAEAYHQQRLQGGHAGVDSTTKGGVQ